MHCLVTLCRRDQPLHEIQCVRLNCMNFKYQEHKVKHISIYVLFLKNFKQRIFFFLKIVPFLHDFIFRFKNIFFLFFLICCCLMSSSSWPWVCPNGSFFFLKCALVRAKVSFHILYQSCPFNRVVCTES